MGATAAQWMSPELLVPERFGLKESRPTKASDCYAFGMVIYEALSGQTSFAHYSSLSVVWKILEGERPKRPQGEKGVWFTDAIWGILEHCWKSQPGDRINAKAVLMDLEGISPLRLPSNVNEGVETDYDSQLDATPSGSQCVSLVFSQAPL